MPYIKQEHREVYDTFINAIVESLPMIYNDRCGHLNYIVTQLMLKGLDPVRYHDFNEIVGTLECIKLEMYRRAVGPYEDKKLKENGDAYDTE